MDEADDFVTFSSRRADIDPNGVMDVVAHGTPNKIQIMTENGPVWVNHRVAANLIKQDPSYSSQPIRLLSCETGACDTGFAQNLANKLGVNVEAPTEILWAYPNGGMKVAPRRSLDPKSPLYNQPDLNNQGTNNACPDWSTQGLAVAVDLQDEFDWSAARDMGTSFALTALTAGVGQAVGTGNSTVSVLARGGVEVARQYIENGKVTNWSGVALAMVGETGTGESDAWASTVKFVNEHRRVLSAGLSVAEKFARGKDVNTLDWTNVAAAAITGESGAGHYTDRNGGFQWNVIAQEALVMGGLSLVVGNKYGTDAGANFFGSQIGSLVTGVMSESNRMDGYREDLGQQAINRVFEDESLGAYGRQQALRSRAQDKQRSDAVKAQGLAEGQKAATESVNLPDRLDWRNGQTTAALIDQDSVVDTGWGSVLGGPDGMMFTDSMREELNQTTQGERANFAAFEVGDQNYSSIDYMEPIPGSEQSNLGTYLATSEPMTDSPSTDDIPSQNYTDSSLGTGPIITELKSNFNQYTVHQEVGLDTVTTGGTLGGLYAKVYDPFGNQYEGVDNDTVTAFENAYLEARRISVDRETAYQDAASGALLGFALGQGFGLAIESATPLVASTARNLFGSVKGIFRSGDEVGPNTATRNLAGLADNEAGLAGRVVREVEPGKFSNQIDAALRSNDPGILLEGQVGKALDQKGLLLDYQSKIRAGFTSNGKPIGIGEIDAETPNYIIEIASGSKPGKTDQLSKLLNSTLLNPDRKPVVLFAPKVVKPQQIKAYEKIGIQVVNNYDQLFMLNL